MGLYDLDKLERDLAERAALAELENLDRDIDDAWAQAASPWPGSAAWASEARLLEERRGELWRALATV